MWHDVEQNTDEWLDLRAGKVTGSSIGKIMANYGKAFGDPAKSLAAVIAVEQLTGKRVQSCGYSNSDMDRGHEQEPAARMLYEETFFTDVDNGGFYDNGDTGSSPDGRVNDNGLIEIKSAIVSIHYERIRKNNYDSQYRWQLPFNLRESGREWIDFVSYCEDFPEDKRLFVIRKTKDQFAEEFRMIESRLEEFWLIVDDIKKTIRAM